MGWHLESVTATCSDFETGELFGTNFIATYRLKYNSSTFGSYTETPKLDWHETIMMNEHHKGETWVFDTNMYTLKPLSNTLKIWARRYVEGYKATKGQPCTDKGHARLFDKNGAALTAKSLPDKTDDAAKAEAARSYLKSNGGIFEIKIHDIPSINKPKPGEAAVHKERLLLFNIGVEGIGAPKVQAYQYLVVNSAQPQSSWVRKHGIGWGMSGIKTSGLKKVPTPGSVSNPSPPTFFAGECW
jgi:hypothetical protein